MIAMSPTVQQVIAGIVVIAAIGFFVRTRLRSSKRKSGSCSKCNLED